MMLASAASKGLPSVLVVEDEGLIREVLALEFEDAGYVTHRAATADKAVALLSRGIEVCAVVTDIRMPGQLDGLGLITWLRQHRPRMPIVVLTGRATEADINPLNPNIISVIFKPYRPADVVKLVSRLGDHPDLKEDE